jgi:hypothetical protein
MDNGQFFRLQLSGATHCQLSIANCQLNNKQIIKMTLNLTVTDRVENNAESTATLREMKDIIPNQCRLILDAMMRGERLTVKSAINQYNIGDLRRRIKDLKDYYKVPISSQRLGYKKEWFMTLEDVSQWTMYN